jgi:uncharacterized protein GlcG (DUF336 family)
MKNFNLPRVRFHAPAASVIVVLLFGAAIIGQAQTLLTQKALSVDAALTVANGALDKCHSDGYRVSLTVLDASPLVKIQVRGDGTGPHTLEHSRRKAYTALTFKRTSGETAKAWAASPTPPPVIEGTVAAQGGVPIKAAKLSERSESVARRAEK